MKVFSFRIPDELDIGDYTRTERIKQLIEDPELKEPIEGLLNLRSHYARKLRKVSIQINNLLKGFEEHKDVEQMIREAEKT